MQKKLQKGSSTVVILIWVVVLVVVVLLVYFAGKNSQQSNSVLTPNGQTTINKNPNGSDYFPKDSSDSNRYTKIYSSNGFYLKYDPIDTTITSQAITNGTYVQFSKLNGDITEVHFFPYNKIPSNLNINFYTTTENIGDNIFQYGDIQTENGIDREYMYKQSVMTILIHVHGNDIVDLSSIARTYE